MMNIARETGSKEFDLSMLETPMLYVMEKILKEEMIEIFTESTHELNFCLYLSCMTFLMPLNLINKMVFSNLTNTKFKFTISEYLDFLIVTLVMATWIVVAKFKDWGVK